jgi:hypothetical protein
MTCVRIGSATWPELSCSFSREATFSVAACAWILAGARGEHGSLAGVQGTGWYKEDKLELQERAHAGKYTGGKILIRVLK